jgi:hypothetical protein
VTTPALDSSWRGTVSAICWLALTASGTLLPLIGLTAGAAYLIRESSRMHNADLLDANEWTWAFVAVDTVGCTENLLLKR